MPKNETKNTEIEECDLLPCPFCGEEMIHFGDLEEAEGEESKTVYCGRCSAMTIGDTTQEAAKLWNDRQPVESVRPDPKKIALAVSGAAACLEKLSAQGRERAVRALGVLFDTP